MIKEEIYLASVNSKNKLHVTIWKPEGEIRAIVQLSHGMQEYIGRYEEFACFLAENSFLVIGNDHLGHGLSVNSDEELGYFGDGKSSYVVDDLREITKYAKSNYGDKIPYILFGHSMGSFMARRYLISYGDELTGAIICGTGYTPGILLGFGKLLCGITKLFHGDKYRTPLVRFIAFGLYNKRIPNRRTDKDWLSRNEAVIDKYVADSHCMFDFTVNGYETLFDVLSFIQNKDNVDKIRKDLPVFLISGGEDPVGEYGKGVDRVYDIYKSAGMTRLSKKIYPEDRHEILGELDKDSVFKDIYDFICSVIQ